MKQLNSLYKKLLESLPDISTSSISNILFWLKSKVNTTVVAGWIFFVTTFDEAIQPIAIFFAVLIDAKNLILLLGVLYLFSKYIYSPDKKISDPTNITLFDRGIAVVGLLLPAAEFSRFFPNEFQVYPLLWNLSTTYLTGLIIFLNCNQFVVAIWNVVVFKEVIRRRGPDSEWAGPVDPKQRFWFKYYIRYHWCCGFCLTSLLETYMFIQTKVFDLLNFSYLSQLAITKTVFFVSAVTLGWFFISAIIGITSNVPLFHGACEFHVGRPKKV